MKNFIVVLFFGLISNSIFSQLYTLSGYVMDSVSNEKIINANIYIVGTSKGTVSNSFGYYCLSINKDQNITVGVSYIGYKTEYYTFDANENKIKNFELANNNVIEEVVVTSYKPLNKTTESGVVEISPKTVKSLPSLGGEFDLIKVLQLMPGIQKGNEGSSGLYVRGGSPDENLILLDDVPLYYVNHLGGFVSIFNANAISNIKLIKGGFPAQYSGRLSSILDIRMKDGSLTKRSTNFTISPITSSLTFETPLKYKESSLMISLRGFYLGLLMKPLSAVPLSGSSLGYNFYDLNVKYSLKISEKNKFYISLYNGDDDIAFNNNLIPSFNDDRYKYNIRWGNYLTAIRWNHLFSSKLFSNITLAYTRYRYSNKIHYKSIDSPEESSINFKTGIKDILLKSNFEYNFSNLYKIKFGTQSIIHFFMPGYRNYELTDNSNNKFDTIYTYKAEVPIESFAYVENLFSLKRIIDGNFGILISNYYIDKTNFIFFEPRLLLSLNFSKTSSLKLSYSKMHQNVHLLTSNTVSLPMDVWLSANKNLKPSNSIQYSVGIYQIFTNKFDLTIEAYYKKSTDLIAYKEGETYLSVSNNWEDKLENNGIGTAYGIEFFIEKQIGKTTGWIGYTISKSNLKFENINFNKPFPYKYDRLHDLSIVWCQKINSNIDISVTWIFGTGYPYNLLIAKYNIAEETGFGESSNIYLYADKNEYRMRNYHRLDLSLNQTKSKKKGIQTISVNIYNAYNRQNPYFYYYDNKKNKLYQQSLFPIIPSVSYSFKF